MICLAKRNRSAKLPNQDQYECAKDFLVKADALEECEDCGALFNGNTTIEEAYGIFDERVSDGETVFADDDADHRQDCIDMLRHVHDDNCLNDDCPNCTPGMREA